MVTFIPHNLPPIGWRTSTYDMVNETAGEQCAAYAHGTGIDVHTARELESGRVDQRTRARRGDTPSGGGQP
jgi:hypothetical protein